MSDFVRELLETKIKKLKDRKMEIERQIEGMPHGFKQWDPKGNLEMPGPEKLAQLKLELPQISERIGFLESFLGSNLDISAKALFWYQQQILEIIGTINSAQKKLDEYEEKIESIKRMRTLLELD